MPPKFKNIFGSFDCSGWAHANSLINLNSLSQADKIVAILIHFIHNTNRKLNNEISNNSNIFGEGILSVTKKPFKVKIKNTSFWFLADIFISEVHDCLCYIEWHILMD